MFPEQLYLPTPYDYAVGIAPRRYLETVEATFTALNTGVFSTLVGPATVLHITHLHASAGENLGVVGESIVSLEVRRGVNNVSIATGPFFFAVRDVANGLGTHEAVGGLVDIWLMPTEQIVLFVAKSGAVLTFRATLSLAGFILPRANIQTG